MTTQYALIQTRKGFAVHAVGCAGMGRKFPMLRPASEIESDVADGRADGHIIVWCKCTGRAGE